MARALRLLLPLLAFAGCASPPPIAAPVAAAVATEVHFEPAPMPHTIYVRRGAGVGALELPVGSKMPPGTGAVSVRGGAAQGSIVTGLRTSF